MSFFSLVYVWWGDISLHDTFVHFFFKFHCSDVIMSAMASQITSIIIVYWTISPGAGQRKHQSSATLAFVWGIHRWPVNSPYKWPVTRKIFPFDDIIMVKYKLWSDSRIYTRTWHFVHFTNASLHIYVSYFRSTATLTEQHFLAILRHDIYLFLYVIIHIRSIVLMDCMSQNIKC